MSMPLTTWKTAITEKKFPIFLGLFFLVVGASMYVYTNTASVQSLFSLSSSAASVPVTGDTPAIKPSRTQSGTIPTGNGQSAEVGDGKRELNVTWRLCKGSTSVDYIPCLDNLKAIKELKVRKHMEHRERHCPKAGVRCLVPLPAGYRTPIPWPLSRDRIWYDNVPYTKLVEYKKEQNWVRLEGNHLVFPGGGTQFKHGVKDYINFIERTLPAVKWGVHTRVVLDVGCGVASFGGNLLDKEVITMSFAPKDEHEAQIQFALERGIPATLAVIGTQMLPFPDDAFDLIHCARCRVHWEGDEGKPLMELNRILRPGGLFVWSATPVYRDDERDLKIWNTMKAITMSICWKAVARTVDQSGIGLVIYQKPMSFDCYEQRQTNDPLLCSNNTRKTPWYAPLRNCITKLSVDGHGSVIEWPMNWPKRLTAKPPSLEGDAEKFKEDTNRWASLVSDVYLDVLPINWSSVRNIMDMNAGYGGFAAALIKRPHWVMNVVPVTAPDTLSVIYDRGLIGVYHDWCESLNTYPRTYDLLHASFVFQNIIERCDVMAVAAEIDRVARPGGYLVVQDTPEVVSKILKLLHSLHWSTRVYQSQFLVGRKGFWRPI